MELIAFKLAILVPLNGEGFILFLRIFLLPPPPPFFFFFNPTISNIAIVFIYICALVKIRFTNIYFSPRFLTKLAKMIICRSIIIAFPYCINDKRSYIYTTYIFPSSVNTERTNKIVLFR